MAAESEVEIMSTTMSTGQKRFYFNLKQNARGRFLKVAEVGSRGRSTIIIPESGWAEFRDMLDSFVDESATEGVALPPRPKPVEKEETESSGLQVWAEGLPWETTETELLPYFQQHGLVEKCTINRTRDGRSRGTATVRFTDAESADAAIRELNGIEIGTENKRKMYVRLDRYA